MALPRSHEAEILDSPGNSESDLRGAFGDIGRVNRWLGGNRSVLRAAARLLGPALPSRLRVLDVGTGGGDIPRAFADWGRQRGIDVRVLGIDLEPTTCGIARGWCAAHPEVLVVRGDGRRLPAADAGVDLVVATLFTHHFRDDDVVALLGEFRRAARVGVIVSDLERARLWVWSCAALCRLFRAHPVFRNDAPLSVRRGFTRRELTALARRAGLGGGVRRAWAGRLVLASAAR